MCELSQRLFVANSASLVIGYLGEQRMNNDIVMSP